MLVLSAKIGDTIYVGEGDAEVVVTVRGRKGSVICLGFDAPRSIPILREKAKLKEPKNSSGK